MLYLYILLLTDYNDTNTRNEFSYNGNDVKPCVRRVMVDPFGFHHAQHGYNPNM